MLNPARFIKGQPREKSKHITDIVIYLSLKWHASHRRMLYREIARQGLGKIRILCIDRPLCPLVTMLTRPLRIIHWLRNRGRIKTIEKNLFIYTPWVFFHDQLALNMPFIIKLNRRLLSWQIRKQVRRLNFNPQRIMTWIAEPLQYDWLQLLAESGFIYECYDEYAEYPGYSSSRIEKIRRYEQKVLVQAKIVLTTSRNLLKSKGRINKDVRYIPNAVEFAHFSKALLRDTGIPPDLAGIHTPRIGFIGGIFGIVDLALLSYLADRLPEVSLVMVGGVDRRNKKFFSAFRNLIKKRNTYYMGKKAYEILPHYLKGLDVCLLPYRLNKWTENCCPSKLYQYLAGGKPVVSTPLPEIMRFEGVVKVGRSFEEFSLKVEEAFRENEYRQRHKRIKVAWKNRWARRAKEVIDAVAV